MQVRYLSAAAHNLANYCRNPNPGVRHVFPFNQGVSLRNLLQAACMIACGLPKSKRVKVGKTRPKRAYELDFVNLHTYGTRMRRYAGLDTKGLVGTNRWKSKQLASCYAHVVPSKDAVKAAVLPTVKGGTG